MTHVVVFHTYVVYGKIDIDQVVLRFNTEMDCIDQVITKNVKDKFFLRNRFMFFVKT